MEAKKYKLDKPSFKKTMTQTEYSLSIAKNQQKHHSALLQSISSTISDKPPSQHIFMLALQKLPHQRTDEETELIAKYLKQQNLFPEFKNSLNILRVLAAQIKLIKLYPSCFLNVGGSKEDSLYKLLKGEAIISKKKGVTSTIRTEGELLYKFEQLKLLKDIQIHCKHQSTLICMSYSQYQTAITMDRRNKQIVQMLVKTSIFSKFKRKELFQLVQGCSEICLVHKENLFQIGDASNGILYMLIEGELAMFKNNSLNKKKAVCYLTSGSLVGQEVLFQEDKSRMYSVAAQSSFAKILQISCSRLYEIIKQFQIDLEQIFTKQYKDFLMLREKHYLQQLEQSTEIKQTFQSTKSTTKMSPIKHQRISNMLKDVQNFTLQLSQKEKLLEKRYPAGLDYKECKLISIERPLFGREDYSNFKQIMKRYGITQAKAKQNAKLPLL